MYFFCNLEPVHCSMSSSDWCFMTCIQISQEAGKVVWYSHLLKNFVQFVVIQNHITLAAHCSVHHSVVSNPLRHHGQQHARLQVSITNPWSLLKLMFIESVMPSSHLILCHPLLFLPPIFPSSASFPISHLCIR